MAVSYTHLGAFLCHIGLIHFYYRNPAFFCGIILRDIEVHGRFVEDIAVGSLYLDNRVPLSKGQLFRRNKRTFCIGVEHINGGGRRVGEGHCYGAVSYTHLDVYKRQVVNISTGIAFRLTVTVGHNDALSVRDTEQLFIVAVNKANVPVGFFDVLVQPFLYIAEAVEVIVAPRWITAKHERIFLGICSEAELSGISTLHFAFLVLTPITHHLRTALKQSELLGAQGVDYIVQVPLELIAFPLRSGIKPSGIKLIVA